MIYTHTVEGISTDCLYVGCTFEYEWDSVNPEDRIGLHSFTLTAVNPEKQIYIDAYHAFINYSQAEYWEVEAELIKLIKKEVG